MKFKRLISCGLIGIMAASLLAGCGSGSGDSGETATTEDGKIQIEYWYSGGKTAVDVLTNMIEEFNEILYLIFDYPHKHYTFKYFEV